MGGYIVKYGEELLHDPRGGTVLVSPEADLEVNASGSVTFKMPATHPMAGKITERDTANPVTVWQDGKLLFCGDILEIGSDFRNTRAVTCRGELAWLNDSIVRPYSTRDEEQGAAAPPAVDEYFEWLIAQHNEQVERTKRFTVGINQGSLLDSNNFVYRASSAYPSTGAEIKEKIIEALGGYVVTRHEGGVRYIDLLADFEKVNAQVIEFGENLLDFAKKDATDDMATFVVPLGAKLSETDYDYDDGYFATSDAKPSDKKDYYTRKFEKCAAMTAFKSGVTYWEKKETDYFKTSDAKPYSGVTYYCKKFTKVSITKFAEGKTYYRLIDGVYTKVTGSFNKSYTYYTMKWEKQSVSKFDSDRTYWEKETYYAQTSDAEPKSGKSYYTLDRTSYSKASSLGRFLKYETYYEYDENADESDVRLDLTRLGDDFLGGDWFKEGDAVYSEAAVKRHGWIGAVVEFDDVTEVENLQAKGLAAAKGLVSPVRTVEVGALDLAMLNPDMEPIMIGQYVRASSKPNGFDSYMLCTAARLKLDSPGGNTYTLGTTFDALTGVQNKRIKGLNATINSVYEQAAAISAEAKEAAVKAAEEAEQAKEATEEAQAQAEQAAADAEEANTEAAEAKGAADAAQAQADKAVQDAYDAAVKAEAAKDAADEATAQAELIQTDVTEAKEAAQAAQDAAGEASGKAQAAQGAADQAAQDAADAAAAAGAAQTKADEAYTAAGQTQAKVDAIEGELDSVQEDAAALRDDLEGQIQTVTNTMAADYAKKTELTETAATLRTEIETSAAGVRQTVEADYAKKTDLTSVQENLQTQVTQNAEAVEQKASRTEAQEIADAAAKEASDKADAAQAAADAADAAAKTAQAEAEQAKANAAKSQSDAEAAQAAADEAKANLATAEAELESVKGRVGVTEADIAAAEAAVATAKKAADDAQADADAAASAASAAQSTANTAVNNAKTAQDTANAAQSAADKAQSDVNALTTRVTTTEAGIKNLSDSISLYAKKTEVAETLGGYSTKEDTAAAIDLKAEEISQTVSNTYQTKSGMSSYPTTTQMNSAINQKANEINLSVESKIGAIEIGGRNLAPHSNSFSVYGSASGITGSITEEGYLKAVAAAGNQNWMSFAIGDSISNVEDNLAEGDEFTISFTMRSADCATPPMIYVKSGMGYYSLKGALSSNWSTVWYSGVWKDANNIQPHFGFSNLAGTFEVKNCKIEKGNKPTDWTPAPEDMANKEEMSAAIKVEADKISANVSETNGLKTRMSAVEQTVDGIEVKLESQQTVNNLASNSRLLSGWSAAKSGTGTTVTFETRTDTPESGAIVCARLKKTSADTAGYKACIAKTSTARIAGGTQYTMSFWAKKVSGGNAQARFTLNAGSTVQTQTTDNIGTAWTRYSCPITVASMGEPAWNDMYNEVGVYIPANVTGEWLICCPQVEEGNQLSAWSAESVDATDYMSFTQDGLILGDQTGGVLGDNLLLGSGSLSFRNGADLMAFLSAALVRLGINSPTAVIQMCGDRAEIRTQDVLGTGRYYQAIFFGADGASLRTPDGYFGVLPSNAAGGVNLPQAQTDVPVVSYLAEADYEWGHEAIARERVDGDDRNVGFRAVRESTGSAVWLGVGSAGYNRGVYDDVRGGWLVHANSENEVWAKGNVPIGHSVSAACTMASGFSVYGTAAGNTPTARKYGKVVTVSGAVTNSAAATYNTTPVTMFTVPSGYRPPAAVYAVMNGTGYNKWLFAINPNGNATIQRYGSATAAVQCAAGSWLPFSITYVIE